ncbi:DVU0524 family FlgM-associated protein [Desulfoluna sp.]|uniref:DVU0524 family FlgM-associated protein n=1 Tax=Desulfoluna sp. TaxID=2045199 RepID=UPI00262B41DF|nr:DVU0524 family FlgM-associated protein [Desulfoluna sp.]
MHVPSYQINNVLKVYSRQVSQNKALNSQKDLGLDNAPAHDKITLSAEGKRKAVIDKVASDIINRLTTTGTSGEKEVEVSAQVWKEKSGEPGVERKKNGRFVYNYIGEDDEKTTSTLSVGNSGPQGERIKSLVDHYRREEGNLDPEESHENL